jgi:hypothetical protein
MIYSELFTSLAFTGKDPGMLMYHLKQFSGTRYELSNTALKNVKEAMLEYNGLGDAGMKILPTCGLSVQ